MAGDVSVRQDDGGAVQGHCAEVAFGAGADYAVEGYGACGMVGNALFSTIFPSSNDHQPMYISFLFL